MLVHGHDVNLRTIVESWVGIVGSVVTILAALIGGLVWVSTHFQSSADAARIAAWMSYQIADGRVTVTRNRVNDCNIRKEAGAMSNLERAACLEYADDFLKATTAAAKALEYAKGLSR